MQNAQFCEATVQKSTGSAQRTVSDLNWDDLRFVLALANAGSLARAARQLSVDHTTVGRRVESAERALGLRLFLRSSTGYALTQDGERLLAPMRSVEHAVHAVSQAAHVHGEGLTGRVRVTSPETFGLVYLAPRLASFGGQHPGLTVELRPSGEVLDLGRGEAQIAVRFFRTKAQNLVVKRVATIGYGLYASPRYLEAHPVGAPEDLRHHRLLMPPVGPPTVEGDWLARWVGLARPVFVSELSIALLEAAKAHGGLAVLPRYLGDATPALVHVPLPDPPSEPVFLTVHEDARKAPKVRALLSFLTDQARQDADLLRGTDLSPAPA